MVTKVRTNPDEVLSEGCVSVKDAAAALGCSDSTVYDLMSDLSLPYVKVRSGRNIPRAGLRKFIIENLVQS